MLATSLSHTLIDRVVSSWPWYLSRGSGLLAAVLLALLIVSGIGHITGHTFRFLEPIVAWATHRRLGIALTIAVVIHMSSLLLDTYQKFDFTSILVPFVSQYHPVYVGLGIIAFYCLIAITLTSIFLIGRTPKLWRLTHYLAYVILGLVFIHALFAGTDTGSGLLRLAWIVGGVVVAIAIIPRLRRARSLK